MEWTVPLSPVFHFSLFHSTVGKVVDSGSRNTPFCLVNPLLRKQPCRHLRQPSVVEKRHIFSGFPTCWYRLHVGFRAIILWKCFVETGFTQLFPCSGPKVVSVCDINCLVAPVQLSGCCHTCCAITQLSGRSPLYVARVSVYTTPLGFPHMLLLLW